MNTREMVIRIQLALLVMVITSSIVFGQTNKLETDKGVIASIAPYDLDVRDAILQASKHPEILTQLQKQQEQSVADFQKIISGFSRKKKNWFYTLTRYPDLVHTLATLPRGEDQDYIASVLPNQDDDLFKASWRLYSTKKKYLIQVDEIRIAAEQNFENSIKDLDAPSRSAFKKLSTMPDVLTLLTNNIDLTTRLGENFKNNPEQLSSYLTALHDSISVQNQYEIDAFKKQIAEDPEAMKEYSKAAQAYSNANGSGLPNQDRYSSKYQYYNSPYYFGNPYSFWYGYPYWYPYPFWYPGSLGFNSGFYWGPGGFGFYGFPSYGFSYWFFNGRHYNRYPHLYHQFNNYYHRNISEHRVTGSVNHGFMTEANNHFNPRGGGQLNVLTSPSSFERPRGRSNQNKGVNTHINANTYHSKSWGSFGGRSNAPSGGGVRSGGGNRPSTPRGRH